MTPLVVLIVQFFILTGTHIVTMTMNSHCVVISIDILKAQPFRFNFSLNVEAIQPFTLDNGVEGLNTSIIPRITFLGI